MILIVTTSLFFVVAYFVVSRNTQQSEKKREHQRLNKMAIRNFTDWKVYSKAEVERKLRIEEDTQLVSNDDLRFILDLIRTGNSNGGHDPLAIRRQTSITSLIVLTGRNRLNDAQKQEAFDTIVAVLKTKDDSFGYLVSLYALREVRELDDKRFVPYILPFLNNTDPAVKKATQETLAKLGYKSS